MVPLVSCPLVSRPLLLGSAAASAVLAASVVAAQLVSASARLALAGGTSVAGTLGFGRTHPLAGGRSAPAPLGLSGLVRRRGVNPSFGVLLYGAQVLDLLLLRIGGVEVPFHFVRVLASSLKRSERERERNE